MDYKYKPTEIKQIVGNKPAIKDIQEWLHSWNLKPVSDIKYKSIFIYGPHGVGKTASINILLNAYNIIELNPEDECLKTLTSIHSIIKTKKNILGKSNIVIVHDIDGITDSGVISKLHSVINSTCIPIVIIGNDKYNKHFKTILPLCLQIKFTTPSVIDIFNYIKPIIKSEKINMNDNHIRECIITCKQDIRKILLMIDFPNKSNFTTEPPNIPNSIFESTRKFMSQLTPVVEKYDIYKYENEDLLSLMVQENYIPSLIINSKDPVDTLDNLYQSSAGLSDYDIGYGDNYAGLLIATNNSHIKNTVNFPKYYNMMMSTYTKRKGMIDMYNNKFNTNRFRLDYFSYITQSVLCNDNYIALVNMFVKFGLTQKDIQDNFMDLLLKNESYEKYVYDMLNKTMKGNITKYFNSLNNNNNEKSKVGSSSSSTTTISKNKKNTPKKMASKPKSTTTKKEGISTTKKDKK